LVGWLVGCCLLLVGWWALLAFAWLPVLLLGWFVYLIIGWQVCRLIRRLGRFVLVWLVGWLGVMEGGWSDLIFSIYSSFVGLLVDCWLVG
jgi:hypothetical protein